MNRNVIFDSPFLLGFEHTRTLIERAAKAGNHLGRGFIERGGAGSDDARGGGSCRCCDTRLVTNRRCRVL